MGSAKENKILSSVEMEKEVISILADSALFQELEAEDRQELVSRLMSLMSL